MKVEKPLLAIHRALAVRREVPLDIAFAGRGARSKVWRVRSDKNEYAFKVYRSSGGYLPPGTDAELRQLLVEKNACVPRPYLTSEDLTLPEFSKAWSLDEFIRGRSAKPTKIVPEIVQGFGQTLRILHDLDPACLQKGHDMRRSAPPVVTRAFGADLLVETQLRSLALRSPNTEIFRKIRTSLEKDQHHPSICHADIHRKQLISNKESCFSLIDFSEARICSRNWDLGAALVWLGCELFDEFAKGYGQDIAKNPHVLPHAWCFAIALASRRTSVSRKIAKPFLQATRDMSSL